MSEQACTCRIFARCLNCIERDGLTRATESDNAIMLEDFITHGAYVDADGTVKLGEPPWA